MTPNPRLHRTLNQRRFACWFRARELGLRLIKGFNDEALSDERQGYRSCRLGLQWRVIYRVIAKELVFQVASITPHDYRRH